MQFERGTLHVGLERPALPGEQWTVCSESMLWQMSTNKMLRLTPLFTHLQDRGPLSRQ